VIRYLLTGAALAAAATGHLALSSDLSPGAWWALLAGAEPESYEEALFVHSAAPRTAMAALVGVALGLAGSVLQQVTLNRLVSPLTIGASSGAWLALVVGGVLAPAFAARNGFWFSLAGALGATALVLGIAGRRGVSGLPVVLAGMAVNILLGAIATVVVLLNDQYVRNLFIWGAGDLTQTGWGSARWLAPQLVAGAGIALLCRRPLALMRLGAEAAAGRGLGVWPFVLAASVTALWMTASAISAVGLIGFIGLLAPNIARLAGARTTVGELLLSMLLGALALLLADALALFAGHYTRDIVPTGASAALIGAPALVLLASGRMRAADQAAFGGRPEGLRRMARPLVPSLGLGVLALFLVALFLGPTAAGWEIAAADELAFALRWPRAVAALAAGAGMAVSGVILQRLLRNPLASPDVIGISAGASLALVAALVFFGASIHEAGAPVAMLGSLTVLGVLMAIGRRNRYAPAVVALAGIALAATLDALLQFVLARGGEETYMIVGWLAGTTFHVTGGEALALLAATAVLAAIASGLHRWLTLLGAGDGVAAGRGLGVESARLILLGLAAVLAALVTALVGPVAFVGLVAPHMASLLGARRVLEQLIVALLIGLCLFLAADWLARTAVYPHQLPAGAVASMLGGAYLAVLLARRRTLAGV